MSKSDQKPPQRLRSEIWFNDRAEPGETAIYIERFGNYGITRQELQSARPVIGIAQTGGDLTPCNRIHMTRRGYLLSTRNTTADQLVRQLYSGYGASAETSIRIHDGKRAGSYQPPLSADWQNAPGGESFQARGNQGRRVTAGDGEEQG